MGSDGAAMRAASLEGFMPIELGKVEAELASRRVVESDDDRPLLRACSLNAIYYVDDMAEAAHASDIVDDVARRHPIRSIGLMFDPDCPPDDVRAWLKVACGARVEGGRVASEEIAIAAHPESTARLASAMRSVLSPDLPVALWWRAGSPFLNRLFKELTSVADAIVVDSIRFGDGPPALDTLRRISDLRGGNVALSDMNWKRTSTWRATMAACFDDRGVLALLPDFDHCEIEFSSGPDGSSSEPSARSLLLAGWLLTTLPSIAGHGDIRGKRSSWASRGSITALSLLSTRSKAEVTITWRSAAEGLVASACDRDGSAMRHWQMRPDVDDEMDLLGRCLDSVAHDPLFDAALRAD